MKCRYSPSHPFNDVDQVREILLESLLQVNEIFISNAICGDLIDIINF
jgi:hypothetical protein